MVVSVKCMPLSLNYLYAHGYHKATCAGAWNLLANVVLKVLHC